MTMPPLFANAVMRAAEFVLSNHTANVTTNANCQQAPAPIECWTFVKWFEAVFAPSVSLLGDFFLGITIGTTVVLSMYIAGRGDLSAPTVTAMLLSPIALPYLPSWARGVVWGLSFLGLVGAFMAVSRRYVFEP